MSTRPHASRSDATTSPLRRPALLLLAGQVLSIVVTQLHAGGDANDHPSIFATYAGSGDWKGVHALQFLAVAVLVAGFVLLHPALESRARAAVPAARLGAALAVVSLALYGVLQAVDGIGNKQVDHAWVTASPGDRSARFASAESMRWLEWGMSSYHAYAMGLAVLAFAVAAAGTAAAPRALCVVMALSGLVLLAEGWVAGTGGFDAAHSVLIVATWLLSLAWMGWLVATTRRPSARSTSPAR